MPGPWSYVVSIQTRWMDVDAYNHVNNVVYYSFFDTVVNRFLIEKANLLPGSTDASKPIALVVATSCNFMRSVTFPGQVAVGLKATKIGRTSVSYTIGVYESQDSMEREEPAAEGTFVHVYVDRVSRRPVGIPIQTRAALDEIYSPAASL